MASKVEKLPKVERLPIPSLKLGEGPHWSVETQSLYFNDIMGCSIHRFHPETEKHYSAKLDVPNIGFITPVAGSQDKFLVAGGVSLYIVTWDGVSDKASSMELLHTLSEEPQGTRINDGKCDPVGRAWFGTMKLEDVMNGTVASFYSYSKDEGCQKRLSEVGLSNGLTWNLSRNIMYYIDTLRNSVDAFDYTTDGKFENRRVVFDLKKNGLPFNPDGMTIDTDGNLWTACFSGSRVIKIDPEAGKLLEQIDLPTPNITSCAWGGKNLDDLYVTSAGPIIPGGAALDDDPNLGAVFRVTGLSARGLPMTHFKST